jgi:hypothetical protein
VTPEAAIFGRDRQLLYHGRIDDQYVELGRARRRPTTHDLESALEAVLAGRKVAPAGPPAVGCSIRQ